MRSEEWETAFRIFEWRNFLWQEQWQTHLISIIKVT